MERAAVPLSAPPSVVFGDGIGERRRVVDPTGRETFEWLCLRTELASVPSFEFALRERVGRLAGFRHPSFARVRGVERLNDPDATLALVSEQTPGERLSQILSNVETNGLSLDINSALCIIRQTLTAMAAFHESARDAAHGALAAERLIVTPDGKVLVVEHVLGGALEQLRFSQERYWNELRIALPRSAGLARFDQRSDVVQLGIVALALILGRPLRDEEYPSQVGAMLASTWAVSARGGFEPLPAGLRGWLGRALQIDTRNAFATAIEARAELDSVLHDGDNVASSTSLAAFLDTYRTEVVPRVVHPQPFVAPVSSVAPRVTPAAAPVPAPTTAPPSAAHPTAQAASPAGPQFTVPVSTHAAPVVSRATPSGAAYAAPVVPHVAAPAPTPIAHAPAHVTPVHVPQAAQAATRPPAPIAPPLVQTRPAPPPASEPSARPAVERTVEPEPFYSPSSFVFKRQDARDEEVAEEPADAPEAHEEEPRPANVWARPAAFAVIGIAFLVGAGFAARHFFRPPPVVQHTGTLVITSDPSGAATIVDGEARGATPLTLALSAGQHVIELNSSGAPPRSIPVTITEGTQVSQYIELPKAGPTAGQLHVRTEPPGADVSVDGTPRGRAPVLVGDLVAGEHVVQVTGELGSMKQTVTVEAGATASLVVPLAAPESAPLSGWVSVTAPIDLQVLERDKLLGTSQTDRIMVGAGRHELDFVNDALGFRTTRQVQVVAGRSLPVKIDVPNGTIALNATPWAEVWIDGEKVGDTPIGNLPIAIGMHDITFRHPDLGELHHAQLVTLKEPVRLSVDLRKK